MGNRKKADYTYLAMNGTAHPPPEEETGDERKVGLEMELKMR